MEAPIATRRQDTEIETGNRSKNILLTPFLLSLPVIVILAILISGSTSPMRHTIANEPIQRGVYRTDPRKPAPSANVVTLAPDTAIHDVLLQRGSYHAKK